MMRLNVDDTLYDIIIERKSSNRNSYIRVKSDLKIYVTTNRLVRDKEIEKFINNSYNSIVRMINLQKKKNEANSGFNYLGKKYDIVYVEFTDISFGDEKVFLNPKLDLEKWYKKQAQIIFKEHLDMIFDSFTRKIPYPDLKIRKMTTRWGVCNTKLKTVTLNLELVKRDCKYLDYVIVHELSHLIEANHSAKFWEVVEENCPYYKKMRKEMKEF